MGMNVRSNTPAQTTIRILIDDVDMKNRVVHARDKTFGALKIAFQSTGAATQIPKSSEQWTAVRQGYVWHLHQRLDSDSDNDALQKLEPGDTRVLAMGDIHLQAGGSVFINDAPARDGVSAWVTISEAMAYVPGGTANGDYIMTGDGVVANSGDVISGSGRIPMLWHGSSQLTPPTGRTLQMRVFSQLWANGAAPGIDVQCGISRVTGVTGGAGALTPTFTPSGTFAIAGELFTAPALDSMDHNEGPYATTLDDDHFLFTLTQSGGGGFSAANSVYAVRCLLQYRHI